MNMLGCQMALRGISQKEMAERAGCHRVTVNKVVRGRKVPSADLLGRFARVLGWDGEPAALMEPVREVL